MKVISDGGDPSVGFGRPEDDESIWRGDNGQKLKMSHYGGSVDESSIYFSNQADEDMFERVLGGDGDDL